MNKSQILIKIRGFTLVEILVVVTIIGLLAAVAAVSYSSLSKGARDAKRKADLEQIRAALEMYRSNNDTYPNFSGDCELALAAVPALSSYISSMPKDPKYNAATRWYYCGFGITTYSLGAILETGGSCGTYYNQTCDATGNPTCNYCLGPYGQLK